MSYPEGWQPPHYQLFVASQIVGKAPWELVDVPLWWIERTLALNAVHQTRIAAARKR